MIPRIEVGQSLNFRMGDDDFRLILLKFSKDRHGKSAVLTLSKFTPEKKEEKSGAMDLSLLAGEIDSPVEFEGEVFYLEWKTIEQSGAEQMIVLYFLNESMRANSRIREEKEGETVGYLRRVNEWLDEQKRDG